MKSSSAEVLNTVIFQSKHFLSTVQVWINVFHILCCNYIFSWQLWGTSYCYIYSSTLSICKLFCHFEQKVFTRATKFFISLKLHLIFSRFRINGGAVQVPKKITWVSFRCFYFQMNDYLTAKNHIFDIAM